MCQNHLEQTNQMVFCASTLSPFGDWISMSIISMSIGDGIAAMLPCWNDVSNAPWIIFGVTLKKNSFRYLGKISRHLTCRFCLTAFVDFPIHCANQRKENYHLLRWSLSSHSLLPTCSSSLSRLSNLVFSTCVGNLLLDASIKYFNRDTPTERVEFVHGMKRSY